MSRGSSPGERRGGRQKGTPNRKTAMIAELLARHGVEPAEGLLRIARAAEEQGDLSLAADCWGKLAQYVYPKPRPMPVDLEQAVIVEGQLQEARTAAVARSVIEHGDGLAERLQRAYARLAIESR